LRLSEALLRIEDEVLMTSHVQHWVEFCRTSKRGLIGLQGVVQSLQEEDDEMKELEELLEVKV
jgi:UDP-N-acetylglucosamine acyltransferase